MLQHDLHDIFRSVRCFEKHKFPNSNEIGNRGRKVEKKFYPADRYILLNSGNDLDIKYLMGSQPHDLLADIPKDNPGKRLTTTHVPISSISISEDSSLICTCSDDAIVLWKLDPQMNDWSSETIGVGMGRILCSAICIHRENIFTSLARVNEIVVLRCVAYSEIDENVKLKFREMELFANHDKIIEPNTWLHNFVSGDDLYIASFSSGNAVSLQVWEVQTRCITPRFRSALQMKILGSADFLAIGEEWYIVAISPEGHCETFVGNAKGWNLLSRLKIEGPQDVNSNNNDFQIKFRICSTRLLKLKPNSEHSGLDYENPQIFTDQTQGPRFPKLLVCVATTHSISIVNVRSGEIDLNLSYEDLLREGVLVISNAKLVSLPGGEIICAYQLLLQDNVCTFRMQFYESEECKLIRSAEGCQVSLFSSGPILPKSVLKKKIRSPRLQHHNHNPSRRMTLGYPIMRCKSLVQRRSLNSKKGLNTFKPPESVSTSSSGLRPDEKNLGLHQQKPSYSGDDLNFNKNEGIKFPTPLSRELSHIRMSFSSDGKLLAVGTNVNPLVILKTTPKLESVSIHRALGNRLTALDFSFNSKYLMFAINDGSTIVINWKSGKELLNMKLLSKFNEHLHAQFYYMDKFLLQPEENRLVFYSYKPNEVTLVWSKLMAGSFQLSGQNITALAAPNQFFSNSIICGLSNKSIQIFDANVEKVSAIFSQSHSKSITCIRINEAPAGYQSHLCDCFLTSAPSVFDPVKLWDLRSQKCVSRVGDVNMSSFVPHARPAFSPCGRYIASGFEDNTVVLYDVRKINSRIASLKGLKGTTVLDCAFERSSPKLWCGSRNGDLWSFTG